MALNRDERIRLLGALVEKDHPKFAHLVQDSPNITQLRKIELLGEQVSMIYGDDLDAAARLRKLLADDDD
jgi:hypothetical protein